MRRREGHLPPLLLDEVAVKRLPQTSDFREIGTLVNEDGEPTQDENHGAGLRGASEATCPAALRSARCTMESQGPSTTLGEVIEASGYDCMTWSSRGVQTSVLRAVHSRLPLRVIGHHRQRGT